MSGQDFRGTYALLLECYAASPEERYLAAVAELGRALVLANVPPEDIAEIHEYAVERLAREFPDKTLLTAANRISAPLMELLMAYGLAFRAWFEERRRLEKELVEIGDAERRRIGQELHDSVGQQLTGIRFMASALAQMLASRSAPEAEDAEAITRLLDETAELARALARGMCPLELVSGDLVPAFEELALTADDRFDITCQLHCQDPVPVVDDATATHLFHIAQEAVANAVKHGKAKHVEIALTTEDGGTTLTVKDDGDGLPDDVEGLKGLGLRSMRYRADVMGASLDVRRHAEGGTIVVCSVPSNSKGETKGGEKTDEAREG